MRQQLQDLKVGLWIDAETHLVRRLGIGQGSLYTGEGVVGFWGYGDEIQLQVPTEVMMPGGQMPWMG